MVGGQAQTLDAAGSVRCVGRFQIDRLEWHSSVVDGCTEGLKDFFEGLRLSQIQLCGDQLYGASRAFMYDRNMILGYIELRELPALFSLQQISEFNCGQRCFLLLLHGQGFVQGFLCTP